MTNNNQLAIQEFNLPDRKTTEGKLAEIREFQNLVKSSLILNHDYGTIPGTQKPTLYKPGAEKLVKLLGLADTFEIIDVLKDWDKGIFSYTVKCSLLFQSEIVSQGLGECNTMEGKYRWRWVWPNALTDDEKAVAKKKEWTAKGRKFTQYGIENDDPYTLVNTVLKMAKKRAMVDAALSVGRLSDIFTQDMEDIANKNDDYEPQMISEDGESMAPTSPTRKAPEPVQRFDPENPAFANKGEFMKATKDRLDMSQKDVLGYLGVERLAELEDGHLVNYWNQLQTINLIPPESE